MAKPTLGYPSRTAAILALRDQGLSPRKVADAIGEPLGVVQVHERSGRRAQHRRKGTLFVLSPEQHGHLLPAAHARGVTVTDLLGQIVAAIAADGLVDAVLDDRS